MGICESRSTDRQLHLNDEQAVPYPVTEDKSVIHYNSKLTLRDIPLKAYDYIVNGKSAIEWTMESYAVTVDKNSDIRNNPNDWCMEHNEPQYIVNLLESIITVSVETMKIVNALPMNDEK